MLLVKPIPNFFSVSSLWKDKRYDFDKFYSDKAYRFQLVKEMANFFFVKTVQFLLSTAKDNGKSNINNWVRSATCEKKYLEALRNNIGFDMNVANEYSDLMTQPIKRFSYKKSRICRMALTIVS